MFTTESFIWFEYLPKATIGAWNCLFRNHSSNIDASDEDEDSGGSIILLLVCVTTH
ncbi:MAG: hypothetical protein KME29_31930 [Calothrix sp. FI2-JRJ7]|nr:hypothetical protein [Calothrix sp. FI2-JRJ7]